MKHVDYIIAGDGFAAVFFALELLRNRQSFCIFSEGKKGASRISAGMVNPVVLKKFTTFPEARDQMKLLRSALADWKALTGTDVLVEEPVHRIFHDEKEIETWIKKSEKDELKEYLSSQLETFPEIHNPYGCGTVAQSFRVNVPLLFSSIEKYLKSLGAWVDEPFEYSRLSPMNSTYGDLHYTNVIFAEGMSVRSNPFFQDLPVLPNKGHHICISPENFHRNETFKKKHFLFPYRDGIYYYGGTYDRVNLEEKIDEEAVSQLENGCREILLDSFAITGKAFAFRPTVKDRKPILGRHLEFPELYVFNGLGTRGLLNAASYSGALFRFCQYNTPLPPEISLERFH